MLVILLITMSSGHFISVEYAKGEQKRAFASFRTRQRQLISESKFRKDSAKNDLETAVKVMIGELFFLV